MEQEAWTQSGKEGDVVSQRQTTDETSQKGTEVHCDEGSRRPARINKTLTALVLQASEVSGIMCAEL